jgi:segregation and condensation protein B
MPPRSLDAILEAVLFASEEALSAERMAAALERQDATPAAIAEAVARLNEEYRRSERSFEIAEVAGGYKLVTLPEFNNYIHRVLRSRSREKMSQAALETLAVIAYRQPVSRADIENIRGVEAGPLLRTLVDRGLIRIVGREEALGHPLLYGTTKLFLELFGLRDLEALPRVEELTKAGQDAERLSAANPSPSGEGDTPVPDEGLVPETSPSPTDATASQPPAPAVAEALAAMSMEEGEAESPEAEPASDESADEAELP